MSPNSQIDLAKPHEQCTIQEREWVSIEPAQRLGRSAKNILWIRLLADGSCFVALVIVWECER